MAEIFVRFCQIGQPSEFWQLTPYQTHLLFTAEPEMTLHQQRVAVYSAWHVAMFQRQEKLDELQKYMPRVHNEQQEAVDEVRAALGSLAIIVPEGD